MKYATVTRTPKRQLPKRLLIVGGMLLIVLAAATLLARHVYFEKLEPVSKGGGTTQLITIEMGATVDQIAQQLRDAGLIQSTWAFKLYVGSKDVRESLEAGTYSLAPSQSVPQIVSQLTHGKVATNLVTILPGQRLDQVRETLINYGFSASDVDKALQPEAYAKHAALVDKPVGASLEGYIFPDSYQKTANTIPTEIITNALNEMDKQLSPDMRAAFAQQGLSTYEGIILASIVEKEVSKQEDRAQAAQVFLKRLRTGITLGSDVTAYYGALRDHKEPTVDYESPYNTHLHAGLPPTPIGTVSASSLYAVAHPAQTDWLYFVSGDDGVTHFSRTLDEHNAAVDQYCKKLCGR